MNHTPYNNNGMPTAPCKEFLSPSELAAWLGVSLRTVASWRVRHVVPYIKIGRLVKFRRSQVEAVLSAHTVEGIRIFSGEVRAKPNYKKHTE